MKKNLFLLSFLVVSSLEAKLSQEIQPNLTINAGGSWYSASISPEQSRLPAATGQVTFYSNGGSGTMEVISGLSEGQTIQLPRNTFTRQGYRFIGWTNTPGNNDPIFQDEYFRFTYYSSNSSLYAVWEPETSALQISFAPNGGLGTMEPIYVRANQTIIVPPHKFTPAEEGYKCEAYGISPNDYDRYLIGGRASFTGSCTLYAHWLPIDGSIGGASEKYKSQTVWVEGVNIMPEDWVQISEKPIKKYAEWKQGCGWYDTDQELTNFCWAATSSNIIHWWFDRNKEYIREYEKIHDMPDFGYSGKGKSDVFAYFREHWKEDKGGFPNIAFNWFVNGLEYEVQVSAKGKGGFFKDIFGEQALVKSLRATDRRSFNQFITEALENRKAFSIDEPDHAITCWGADFDEEGYVCALYYSDSGTPWNNTQTGRDLSLTKIAIKYHENQNWKPYMETSVLINGEIQHGEIPIARIYSYSQGTEYWKTYFETQGQENYTLISTDATGKTFDTQVIKAEPDAVITLPVYPFRTINKAVAGEQVLVIGAEGTINISEVLGKEITLQYADNLPFETTTVSNDNFTDAHWYLLNANNVGTLSVMQYDAQNKEHIKVVTQTEVDVFDEANLWCISGNVTDGFRLYNKAAGTSLAVTYTNENGKATMNIAEDEVAVWSIAAVTGQEDSKAFCFRSKNAKGENSVLCLTKGEVTFGPADNRATALSTLNRKEGLFQVALAFESELQNLPNGTVGGPIDRNAVVRAIEILKSNPTEENYQAVCVAFENKISLNADKTYYLLGAGERSVVTVQKDGFLRVEATGSAEANGIFLLEETQDGTYNIKVQGEYLGAAKSNNANNEFGLEGRSLNGNKIKKGTFALIAETGARFYLQNINTEATGNTYVHLNGQIVAACGDRVDGTLWYLVEASTLSITITETGYATAHYPFAVQLPQYGSLKAYTGRVSTDGTDNKLVLEELDGEWIPPYTAVVLVGEANTYSLTISAQDESGTTSGKNDLDGTLLPVTVSAKDYVLDNKNGVAGFYKVSDNGLNLDANKAYLPGIHVPASVEEASRFVISFNGDDTTGIDSNTAEKKSIEEYYDLQGRRVLNPTEGIYVTKSGKKVLITR